MKSMENRLTSYSDEQRNKAIAKFNIIKSNIFDAYPMKDISLQSGVPISTLYKWKKLYQSDGLMGLIHRKRSDSGTRKVDSIIIEEIQKIRLKNKRISIATIHRKIDTFCKDNKISSPSYKQVYDIVNCMPISLIDYAHKGDSFYSNKYDLVKLRESTEPNEIWQADHTMLDILVYDQKGHVNRPWLTIILDDYSRAVAGYHVSFESPNAKNTALTLHQAIWHKADVKWPICGIPEKFYTDHGSDFTSNHLEQVAVDLKINLIFSKVGIPRGRGKIERFFLSINQMFLEQMPGYLGNSDNQELLDYKQFNQKLHHYLVHEYNHKIHSTKKSSPVEMWNRNNFMPNMPISLEELDLLLLEIAKTRKIHSDGIHFQGFKYTNTNLAAYIGEQVLIRYNPNDLAEIRVFYESEFLCTAIAPELAEYSIDIKDLEYARNKRRREIKQQISDLSTKDILIEEKSKNNSDTSKKDVKKLKRYINE
ncbi:DDE-type integrase/transposase/recombinase [Macrococcus equipercicus]|uniref:DDE-type integrase/transposase/recombinase n=1 Tax=Macrococcus equipercicus TaxID=69967 RepID=A0ABQ6RAL7_9STAP|nr:Mu transposase C-terminal domain-containing protein [Macrococcus equipercicus]KAA1040364.1 DDE-type integrase/transposase/recombinase [Macrococcus equipercicus]